MPDGFEEPPPLAASLVPGGDEGTTSPSSPDHDLSPPPVAAAGETDATGSLWAPATQSAPPGSGPSTASVAAAPPASPGEPQSSIVDGIAIYNQVKAQYGSIGRSSRNNLVLVVLVVLVFLTIGLGIGAAYLNHLASNTTSGGSSAEAASNLTAAQTAVTNYVNANGLAALVAQPSSLQPKLPSGVILAPISTASQQVAFASLAPGTVVLTALQPHPTVCLSLLMVFSPQQSPVFVTYSSTSSRGTFFFEAPTGSSNACDPTIVQPPPGAYLSVVGFPTATLPTTTLP